MKVASLDAKTELLPEAEGYWQMCSVNVKQKAIFRKQLI
jgi:hypothetical protein